MEITNDVNKLNSGDMGDKKVFCKRCGRVLIGEHSKSIGYGPNCYRILQKEKSIKLFGDDRDG